MQISQGEVTITDIPIMVSIVINKESQAITLNDGESSFGVTPADVAGLRDALTEALKLVGHETAAAGPRMWGQDSTDPGPTVTRVVDRDGDVWYRLGGLRGWSTDRGSFTTGEEWNYVTNYAPLTEVRD